MASTNFTTHYSIPLPLGTDLTTPMDYNEAAEAIDTALFEAVTDASNAAEAAGEAVNTANTANTTAEAVNADLALEKAKIIQLQTRMTAAENDIDDVYTDVTDMITAYKEPSATSTHAYAIGDYFIYNETLYRATAAIAIGATIVPNTNCETTNVSSELIQINSELTSKMGLPDYANSIDIENTLHGFVAPSDGIIYANLIYTDNCDLYLKVNNVNTVRLRWQGGAVSGSNATGFTILVKAGDFITYDQSQNVSNDHSRFVPLI